MMHFVSLIFVSSLSTAESPHAKPRRPATVAGTDGRRTAKNFAPGLLTAAQVQDRYGATGDILCTDGGAQAQLTIKNDLITSNAHTIFDKECKTVTPLKTCKFHVWIAGKLKAFELKEMVKSGFTCPTNKPPLNEEDWIIFRLKKPVDARVRPYPIAPAGQARAEVGQKVVLVSKSFDWPKGLLAGWLERPRHYDQCTILKMPVPNMSVIQTACATSAGASGGSLLTEGENPTLVGVVSGWLDPRLRDKCDRRPLETGEGPYKMDCWGSMSVEIAGDFRKALLAASGLPADDKPADPAPPQ